MINTSIEKNPRLLEYMWILPTGEGCQTACRPKGWCSGIMINPDTLLKDGAR